MLVQVRDKDSYRLVTEWDDEEYCCKPWAGGDYVGHCGGCPSCMEMQACHGGYLVERPSEYRGWRWLSWKVRDVAEHFVPRMRYLYYRYWARRRG